MGRKPQRTEAPNATVLDQAIQHSQDYFRGCQYNEGYWWGELESNATMAAEYVLLSYFLGKVDQDRWRKSSNYILSKQREDGSWGQYYQAPGDVSTSVEAYFALKLAGYSADSEPLRKAREFILSRGGVPPSPGVYQNLAGSLRPMGLGRYPQHAARTDAVALLGAAEHL